MCITCSLSPLHFHPSPYIPAITTLYIFVHLSLTALLSSSLNHAHACSFPPSFFISCTISHHFKHTCIYISTNWDKTVLLHTRLAALSNKQKKVTKNNCSWLRVGYLLIVCSICAHLILEPRDFFVHYTWRVRRYVTEISRGGAWNSMTLLHLHI